jgi:uncharacterized protein
VKRREPEGNGSILHETATRGVRPTPSPPLPPGRFGAPGPWSHDGREPLRRRSPGAESASLRSDAPRDLPSPVRPAELLGFLAFSHGWTWAWWGAAAAAGESVWDWPASALFYVGGAGVFLGGVMMTGVVSGGVGLRDLGRRTLDPRPIPGRWWVTLLLFYPLLTLAAAGVAVALGVTDRPLDLPAAADRMANPVGLVSMMVFLFGVGPLPEEIGWRGFLQDRLQARWTGLAAALAIALVWWVWHLPLLVLPGYYDAFGRSAPAPLDFLWNLIPAAILYAWIFNRTHRSVLAVIVFHFMENFTSEFLGVADAMRPHRLALMVGAAVVVVLVGELQDPRRRG